MEFEPFPISVTRHDPTIIALTRAFDLGDLRITLFLQLRDDFVLREVCCVFLVFLDDLARRRIDVNFNLFALGVASLNAVLAIFALDLDDVRVALLPQPSR